MAKKAAATKKTFGTDLMQSMKLVLAHRRGEVALEQVWPLERREIGPFYRSKPPL